MLPSIYLETTIFSYLTAWRARDIVIAGKQEVTEEWWNERKARFSKNGPRYNLQMDDDERRHFNNLILLCDEHHTIIDNKENEKKYPIELLKVWKRDHESKLLHSKLQKKAYAFKYCHKRYFKH